MIEDIKEIKMTGWFWSFEYLECDNYIEKIRPTPNTYNKGNLLINGIDCYELLDKKWSKESFNKLFNK